MKTEGRQMTKRWKPEIGQETRDFLEHVVPEESRDNVLKAAESILSRGVSPKAKVGRETGLVVGYVQSGKTMSFEAVMALARDNGFQMVIVVTGISNPLLDQSTGRIREDFRLDDADRTRNWVHFENPKNDDSTAQTLHDRFEDWRDESTPDGYKQTVLLTLLKNHLRLENLVELLQREKVNTDGVPTLIIDDEADQASLNTKVNQSEESTTYRQLMAMRNALPLHTYLQYTATPQAPLLLRIINSLSPNFVEVLTPGSKYVGGNDFFGSDQRFISPIPGGDVPRNDNPIAETPKSLLEALRVFMVGVTISLKRDGDRGNRSMLVHPSHLVERHQEYYNWLYDAFEEWKRILSLQDNEDPDKRDLIEEFRTAYNDLKRTIEGALPSFEDLIPFFRVAFRRTRLLEVNARTDRTPTVDWSDAYGWILVGGQAMDRGFTVRGLTVTYMPRGIGVGNADALQQRARFFGYKRDYLDYCRVYLEKNTHHAFQAYVLHEEQMRNQLEILSENEESLNNWKRVFFMDRKLNPCRRNVLEFDYIRSPFPKEWISPRVISTNDEVITANRKVVLDFLNDTPFENDKGHPKRTEVQQHKVANGLSLREVMERLLAPISITSSRDIQQMTTLLLQLGHVLDRNADERCSVYQMSPATGRKRGIKSDGEIINLFQGAAPVYPSEGLERGDIYPGDLKIRDEEQVTVQIHRLDLTQDGVTTHENVYVLAVRVPRCLSGDWIYQNQDDQEFDLASE